jgi:adenylate cyclase
MRLSPFDPLGYMFSGGLAFAYLTGRQFEDAADWADRCLQEQPRFSSAIRVKVASCTHIGRIAEARDWLGRLLDLQPGFTIAKHKAYANYISPETLEILAEGLRKAGLPEE